VKDTASRRRAPFSGAPALYTLEAYRKKRRGALRARKLHKVKKPPPPLFGFFLAAAAKKLIPYFRFFLKKIIDRFFCFVYNFFGGVLWLK